MNLAEALSRLAKVPPKLFTRERRGLVEALKKAGHAKAARVVQARRTLTAPWQTTPICRHANRRIFDLQIADAGTIMRSSAVRHVHHQQGEPRPEE